MAAEQVALYRCKKCGARLFERDCAGHLRRHGVAGKLSASQVLARFERGAELVNARPGDGVQPMYYKAAKKKPAVEAELGEDDLN